MPTESTNWCLRLLRPSASDRSSARTPPETKRPQFAGNCSRSSAPRKRISRTLQRNKRVLGRAGRDFQGNIVLPRKRSRCKWIVSCRFGLYVDPRRSRSEWACQSSAHSFLKLALQLQAEFSQRIRERHPGPELARNQLKAAVSLYAALVMDNRTKSRSGTTCQDF
jgi:hypothetical protein